MHVCGFALSPFYSLHSTPTDDIQKSVCMTLCGIQWKTGDSIPDRQNTHVYTQSVCIEDASCMHSEQRIKGVGERQEKVYPVDEMSRKQLGSRTFPLYLHVSPIQVYNTDTGITDACVYTNRLHTSYK